MTLKKRWFDMIKAGDKKEEYREIKDYWMARLISNMDEIENSSFDPKFQQYDQITFVNGYSKNAPRFTIECKGIEIGYGKQSWGGLLDQQTFIIKLGTIISSH
jgi:hypothetical protein